MQKRVILLSIFAVLIIGLGAIMMEQHYSGISFDTMKSKPSTKDSQLAYLKDHEQEIVELVKSQSPKVESVQIDWDETQWSDGGVIKSEYYINVYGRINDIEDSGWVVDIPLNNDNSVNMDEMYVANSIDIGGEPLD